MKKILCAAAVAAFFCMAPAVAEQFDAKVIGVADGDTLTVLFVDGQTTAPKRVRLSGIDAAEKAQAFGAVAREQLSRMAFGKLGHLDCRATDQCRRSVCLVRVEGLDVGLLMVRLGLAWHYKRYASTQSREEAFSYAVAENAARAAKTGLWRDLGATAEPVPSWDCAEPQRPISRIIESLVGIDDGQGNRRGAPATPPSTFDRKDGTVGKEEADRWVASAMAHADE